MTAKQKKKNRRKPSVNLTLGPTIKIAAELYREKTGKSVSALASDLLQEYLEKKGYLSTQNSVKLLAEQPEKPYGEKKAT